MVARRAQVREHHDLDAVYLAEMTKTAVLTPEQELELGHRIVAGERAMLEALVRAPSATAALARVRLDLESGRTDVRDVLLNPDEQGLDLAQARTRLLAALDTTEDLQRRIEVLTDIRLDGELVDALTSAVETGARGGEPEDTAALAVVRRARTDLRRTKDRLVVGNLRLVVLFARKYLGRGVPLLDLVQEGNLGLLRAADKFDHRRGFRFSTYAAWWIRQALQRGLLDRSLRLPVHVADDRRRLGRVRAAFTAQHRREPTPEELATLSGLSRDRIANILSLPAQPASLDAPVGEGGEAALVDFLPSSDARPDEEVAARALGDQLTGLLHALSAREQQVLRLRFGIGNTREHTLEEVGKELSLTRERIRQIERSALEKLRAKSERIELQSYLER